MACFLPTAEHRHAESLYCPYTKESPGIFSVHLELIYYTDYSYTLIFLKCFLGPVRSTVCVLDDNINQSDGFCVSVEIRQL